MLRRGDTAMIEAMLTPPAAAHALLFASGEPLEKKRLAALLDMKEAELKSVIETLAKLLKGSGVTTC